MRDDAYAYVSPNSATILNMSKAKRRGAKSRIETRCPYANKDLKKIWHEERLKWV